MMPKISKLTCCFGLLCLVLAHAACKKERTQGPLPAPACNFYYWKTTLAFDAADKAEAQALGMQRLYLRYFDVDWSPSRQMAVPVGVLDDNEGWSYLWREPAVCLDGFQVVPTVFLTNRVFAQEINVDTLAAQVSRKVAGMTKDISRMLPFSPDNPEDDMELTDWSVRGAMEEAQRQRFLEGVKEVQLDCDWTPATRQRYFAFLKAMQAANPDITFTCTVRLHQFRDREKAGIPPVGRATLMCYNVAPVAHYEVPNAIYQRGLVEGYLRSGEYPIPLEAALPLFSWGVLFHEGQFKGLAAGLTAGAVASDPNLQPLADNRYRFLADTVYADVYMRAGDVLRFDGVAHAELLHLAGLLSQKKSVYGLSFFDWHSYNATDYKPDEIFAKFMAPRR